MPRRTRDFSALTALALFTASVVVVACSSSATSPAPPRAAITASPASKNGSPASHHHKMHPLGSVGADIKYVFVIIQENRTLNNLFNGFTGATTTTVGPGGTALTARSLYTTCDPHHRYQDFVTDANWNPVTQTFGNDGWSGAPSSCGTNGFGLSYVSTIPGPYKDLAKNFTLADETYQMNMGPSFPAHQYLIAGQSGGFLSGTGNNFGVDYEGTIGNPGPGTPGSTPGPGKIRTSGGCDTSTAISVPLIMPNVNFPAVLNEDFAHSNVPCQDYQTIFDAIIGGTNPQPTWRYYAPAAKTIWTAPVGVSHLWRNGAGACATAYSTNCYRAGTSEAQDIYDALTSPSSPVPNLTYIVPCPAWSDHANVSNQSPPDGPNWVAFLVKTIGQNAAVWSHSVIIVTWDDWGGWYDEQVPSGQSLFKNHTTIASPDPYNSLKLDPYEYGYRVPMLVITPYLKKTPGQVDSTYRSQAAILRFIENTFNTTEGKLGTLDNVAGNGRLSELVDVSVSPTQPPPTPAVTGFPAGDLPTCPDTSDLAAAEPND